MVSPGDFKRITPYIYEIPAAYRGDMRVPARFYADAVLLEETLGDKSLTQLVNTATLPGVVKYALAMPDIHQGYGFPIGGVIATLLPDGVISPGGVGYDINCLSGDSQVLHEHGYTRPIADLEADWQTGSLTCQDFTQGRIMPTSIVAYMKQQPRRPVYCLQTEAGDLIQATADHPFWTPQGMIPLEQLRAGDTVACYPFTGVPYEAPQEYTLVDEGDVERALQRLGKASSGNTLGQVIHQLKRRRLLPLLTTSPQLPYLIKLLGYQMGDGTLYFSGEAGKGTVWFYGNKADLELIRADVFAAGFTPSRVYTRTRQHEIQTEYDRYTFEREEASFKVTGTAFAVLLSLLGAPVGAKSAQNYSVPPWLMTAPRWQQRLFMAAHFGAELSTPQPFARRNYNFYPPILSLNKREGCVVSGRQFLTDLSTMLANFGVEAKTISERRAQQNQDGSYSYRLQLILSSQPNSLINLWSQVGFVYNQQRHQAGLQAAQYLKCKAKVVAQREQAARKAAAMHSAGVSPAEIYAELTGTHVNRRFVERSLYETRQSGARISARFETFDAYCRRASAGIAGNNFVWTKIASIEPVELAGDPYGGLVYDFTVAHHDHNFIANGFVVSNCGVRLLGTQLAQEDVVPYLDNLASALYANCPSGVGEKGHVRLTNAELDRLVEQGGQWALKNGYATPADLERTEERGRLSGADAGKVSARAKERGRPQIGTLGAGNHFIEVDVIDEIFHDLAAQRMGLYPGQVVVQIHCGSRGFGHQVCTDYVRLFQESVQRYGIKLADRELVCAPLSSPEGQDYFAAMNAAANYAFVNRQVLTFYIRRSFEQALAGHVPNHSVYQIYDIAHNMAKIETHVIDGKPMKVCVHRKGATRAFGPGSPELPDVYRDIGQPVLVPGSMGTASWVLLGTTGSMEQTFGSTCHGAGRTMSRSQAKKMVRGSELRQELEDVGIQVRAGSMAGLAEEAPMAYKDVDRVVEVVHGAGIAHKVARLTPIAVIKG